MTETLAAPSPTLWNFLENRVTSFLVLGYQALILLSFIVMPFRAFEWLKTPFIGAFVGHTLVVNSAAPTRPGTWELHAKGLPSGYQLTTVAGEPVQNTRQLRQILNRYQVGDRVRLTLRSQEGVLIDREIKLQRFPQADRITFLWIPYLTGLAFLASSLWVFSLRWRDAAGRAFGLFTASAAFAIAGLFDVYTTQSLLYLWTCAIALAGGALLNLSLLFPQEMIEISDVPFLRWIGYIPSGLFALIALPTLYDVSRPFAYSAAWRLEFLFLGLVAISFLALTTIRKFSSHSPIVREQARLILLGAGLSLAPIALWFLVNILWSPVSYNPSLLLPLSIFPVITGYTLLRYRLLNTNYLLSRTLLYGALSILTSVGYALLVGGAGLISWSALPATPPILIGLIIFLLALLLNPLRQFLLEKIDNAFFRGQKVYRERLQSFSGELTLALDLPSILHRLREYVSQALYPTGLHIFIYDPFSDSYAAATLEGEKPSTDLRFPSGSPLVQALARRRSPVFVGGMETLSAELQVERARLALLGAQLYVPLPGRGQLVGWLALGPRRSGEPYTDHDLTFLDSLSDQAALAIERAQVVADLEQRVQEMDVLARLARGVVITLAFDDILELIYAQTNHLIPTQDFRVTLYDPARDRLDYAFFLENDERLRDWENQPIPRDQGLEREIIRSQRSILTDDYDRECRSRGILPSAQGIVAWMGVPLNAGAGTIGAISLGSREPSTVYTEQQRGLLQSIADQAAGAIVKARLLDETERRARQLAILNEVGRSLTSTLELKPLLDQILKSATEILNCEAGSLFLLDEGSRELIFEVTVGPVAGNLVGHRLPPGTGLVGKVVETGLPLIANDVRKTQGWFEEADKQTGFVTRDLLVVPMQVKDRTIGVIEVINKGDGSPFHPDDQELLSTFASQAAVSVENARLYMQTDQALSARVEELSVLQRIDRELNTSLDVSRAMHITLDWALRQSGAEAGLVGIVEEAGLQVMASQGYPDDLFQPIPTGGSQGMDSRRLALELEAITQAVQSGLPQSRHFGSSTRYLQAGNADGDYAGEQACLLPDAMGQLVIPIRREGKVIGALLLEGSRVEFGTDEMLDFLSRLSDHAAIAISNAQFYTAIQEANRAKSDFVSFVSHELKTPMTSIKGYADLLAAGAVGPVNEAQANFLNTIRSNVNRMSTLVSDLADVSRIEAGRLRLEFRAVSIPEIIEEVRRSNQAHLEGKEQTLTVLAPADLPNVWGDYTRLLQILTNLVSNANKYSPRSGQITISAEPLTNPEEPGIPEMVHVTVQDTGFGISMEDQKKIFTKFFRSENQNIRESPGTGLGLNITRYLVEMQGGRIWFESQAGKGTIFHFTLPIANT